MSNFIEFCPMVFEKMFKVVHAKKAKIKTVLGAITPISADDSL